MALPRKLRRRFFDMRLAKWLVPQGRCFALPVAVRRNRFFVPLWVFIFGMAAPEFVVLGSQMESPSK